MIEGASVEPLGPDDPREIGPYLLQGRLGSGGMGQVYLGRTADGAPAAIKVVHHRLAADQSFRQRFAREIAVAGAVQGRWVAALLASDAHARRAWLATEYVDAPSLDRVVGDSGPLPEQALVALAHRLAEALAQLHAQGVVHRDLKPSNVLVADDGPRLIDFGVARAIDATALTQTGMVLGTPAFMSPEQAAGDEIGPPSDVFSLASVLVYAATGRGPFGHTANALAMLRRITDDQPDLDGLPGRLREVLELCFAKDPADRPAAAELAAAIAADALAVRSPLDPWDPTEIGPYRLLGRLGAGGMGQVYLGQAEEGWLAAVKVVHEQYAADRRFRERFAREVATARAVRGPRIAELLDADPDASIPWLATEYVPGPSLEQAVAGRGALPEPEALRVAGGLAEALEALHASGVVHRDLKPSNVLLADDGPKLIDFGIARAFDETALTRTGGVLGAPGYMSPEQAMGEEVGPPSDVFSFAAVVTFAVTGRGPFGTSETPLALLRRVVDNPPDLTGVPQQLLDVVRPCLAKDPAERPTALELADRLAGPTLPVRAVAGRSGTMMLEPSPTESVDAGPRKLSRRGLLIGGALAAAAAATAGGVVIATRTPTRSARWTTSADPGATDVAASGNDVYMVDRSGFVHALDPADGAAQWTFQLPGSAGGGALRATAGTCYVSTTYAGVYALDAASGQLRWTVGTVGKTLGLAPGGMLVYTSQEPVTAVHTGSDGATGPMMTWFSNVQGLDPTSGATKWSFRLDQGEFALPDWALVAAGHVHLLSNSRIFALDPTTGVLQWAQPSPAESFNWAASGAGLFYATSTQVVKLDATTGATLWQRVLHAPTFGLQSGPPAIACNDQSLFLASVYRQEAWDAATGERQWHADQHGFDLTGTSDPEWTISTNADQIATSDKVILIESRSATACRVSARSTRDGTTLWTSEPVAGVGNTAFDLALGADHLYWVPLDLDRVVRAVPIT
jgi:serine/threonine protein kinase/outer membrane protein assembly factor BamB